MKKIRNYLKKFLFVLLVSIMFPLFIFSMPANADNTDNKICVSLEWANIFYEHGWQAYEKGEWVWALQNLFVYYQVAISKFNHMDDFRREVSDALQHAQQQLNDALNQNANLRSQLNWYKKKHDKSFTSVKSSSLKQRPKLRRYPPKP